MLLELQEVEAPRLSRELAHEVVRLSALLTGLLYTPEEILGIHNW